MEAKIKELQKKIEEEHKITLQLCPLLDRDAFEISAIVVPKESRKKGLGSAVMNELIAFADKENLIIVLTPSKDFGATSVSRLRKFYHRFGFVRNLGRNKDYLFVQAMIRKPKKNKLVQALRTIISKYYYHRTNLPISKEIELGRLKKTGKKWIAFDNKKVDKPFWATPSFDFAKGSGIRRVYKVKLHFPDSKIFGNQDKHYQLLKVALENNELYADVEDKESVYNDISSLAYDEVETKEFMDWVQSKGFEGALVKESLDAKEANVMVFDAVKVELLEEVYTP